MHYNVVEKLFGAHRFGHSDVTRRKTTYDVFTTLFWDTLHLTS